MQQENNGIPDINKPIENPVLKELMKQVLICKRTNAPREQSIEVFNKMTKEMVMNARFLVVAEIDKSTLEHTSDGKVIFTKNTRISFPALENSDGSFMQPVFTDWDELRKWEPFREGAVDTITMSFDDVFAVIGSKRDNLIINPFGEDVVLFPFDMIAHFKMKKDAGNNSQD